MRLRAPEGDTYYLAGLLRVLDDGQRVREALKDKGFENESLLQHFGISDSDDAHDLFTGTFNFAQKHHFYRGSLHESWE